MWILSYINNINIMTCRGIYFKIIAVKPIKEVIYCCIKVWYSLQKCITKTIWGGVICIISKSDLCPIKKGQLSLNNSEPNIEPWETPNFTVIRTNFCNLNPIKIFVHDSFFPFITSFFIFIIITKGQCCTLKHYRNPLWCFRNKYTFGHIRVFHMF